MTRSLSRKNLSSSLVYLYTSLLVLALLTSYTVQVSKDDFYKFINSMCYSKELYTEMYQKYDSKYEFYWTDFFIQRDTSKEGYKFKPGTTYLFLEKIKDAKNMPFSFIEVIEFYNLYFKGMGYRPSVNTKKTVLYNPDGRDFLPLFDSCYMYEARGIFYNKLNYTIEPLVPIIYLNFLKLDEEEYFNELLSIAYQVGKGLLFLFQNNYHYLRIDKDIIGFRNTRGLNVYKLGSPTLIRYVFFITYSSF